MKRFALLFFMSLAYSFQGVQQESDFVHMNFASHLYPTTPLRNVQALTMRLWGQVQQAYSNESSREVFMTAQSQESFTHEVVHLHSIFQVLLASLELQIEESPELVANALQDCQHIIKSLTTTAERYDALMVDSDDRLYLPVVMYMFDALIQKLYHVLETGSVVAQVYALLHHSVPAFYPKHTTPLLLPAKIVPVAPMA